MYERLGEAALKSGERLEIGLVTAPDGDLGPGIRALLGHKGPTWREHIRAALEGEADSLETRFYLGLLEGAPVANVMTVERHGVGILGHVFTQPEHRRKGIIREVMQRQMDHFRSRGGHVLTLGTGFESPPYWIYHSFGFRSLQGGFMRYETDPESDFVERWFVPGPARVEQAAWGHWPLLALTASYPATDFLRSVVWRMYGIGNLEGPYVEFMATRSADPGVLGVVLETESGAVAGCATVVPLPLWPGVRLLDVFAHPQYEDRMEELIRGLSLPAGRIAAYADVGDTPRTRALQAAGFTYEATLPGMLRTGEESRPVQVFGLEKS